MYIYEKKLLKKIMLWQRHLTFLGGYSYTKTKAIVFTDTDF
jgi:hypothetical protein